MTEENGLDLEGLRGAYDKEQLEYLLQVQPPPHRAPPPLLQLAPPPHRAPRRRPSLSALTPSLWPCPRPSSYNLYRAPNLSAPSPLPQGAAAQRNGGGRDGPRAFHGAVARHPQLHQGGRHGTAPPPTTHRRTVAAAPSNQLIRPSAHPPIRHPTSAHQSSVITACVHIAQVVSSDFQSVITQPAALLNAFAGWFDVQFCGSESDQAPNPVELTTAPSHHTHWAQQLFYVHPPLEVQAGDVIKGSIHLTRQKANHRLLYLQATPQPKTVAVPHTRPASTRAVARPFLPPPSRPPPPRCAGEIQCAARGAQRPARHADRPGAHVQLQDRLSWPHWREHVRVATQPRCRTAHSRPSSFGVASEAPRREWHGATGAGLRAGC